MVLNKTKASLILLTLATAAYAQTFVSYNGPSGNNPALNGGSNANLPSTTPNNNNNNNPNWAPYWPQSNDNEDFYTRRRSYIVVLHAVLASFAFGCFFPVGGIMIKLGAFNGIWWIHGVFQTLALFCYIGAAVLGFYIAMHLKALGSAHAIIGLVLVFTFAFQPFLGLMHHYSFEKRGSKTFFTYAHIWIARIGITVGIANGGLGLQLASQTGVHPPSQEAIIAYASIAGLFWFMYVLSAVYASNRRMLPEEEEEAASGGGSKGDDG